MIATQYHLMMLLLKKSKRIKDITLLKMNQSMSKNIPEIIEVQKEKSIKIFQEILKVQKENPRKMFQEIHKAIMKKKVMILNFKIMISNTTSTLMNLLMLKIKFLYKVK